MKGSFKKRVVCSLIFVMLVTIIQSTKVPAYADEESTTSETEEAVITSSDGMFSYEILEDGSVSIKGYNGSDNEVVIPDTLDGYAVSTIGEKAFAEHKDLTSISIPNSVTKIDNSAFALCASLKDINIPDGVKSIGDFAFLGCKSMTSVNLPEGITSVGYQSFYACGITNINIPKSLSQMGSSAFSYCSDLTEINLDGATQIGEYAFYGCSSLTNITIPESVRVIGLYAFERCSLLGTIKIESKNITIMTGAFWDTAYYEDDANWIDGVLYIDSCLIRARKDIEGKYKIAETTNCIANNAFADCNKLTGIDIPSGVVNIGENAFYGCNSLSSITIPRTVTTIGEEAFKECNSLTISGYSSSYAEEYAEKNNIPFVVLPDPKLPTGDVSDDGKIDAMDALMVLKSAARVSELNEKKLEAADVTKDGRVDAADALLILKYAARIIDSF